MDQMNTEIIEILDSCLDIDDYHHNIIKYGIIYDAEHLGKLFINDDQQLYSGIEVDDKYVDKFIVEVLREYHDDYFEDVLKIHPKLNGHSIDLDGIMLVIQSKKSNVKAIIELYNLMKILKAAGRIPEDAFISNIRWG